MALLEVNHLNISFGGLHAVDDFHVSIEKGQLYGLIGPNGAGKTTIWTDRISQERVPLISTRQELPEHSRISVCSIR